jgi:hypothetical protein
VGSRGFVATLLATLAIWFGLMIGAIVAVKNLSDQGAITLVGGVAIFAVLLSAAVVVDGFLWLRWYRTRRRSI